MGKDPSRLPVSKFSILLELATILVVIVRNIILHGFNHEVYQIVSSLGAVFPGKIP